MDEQKVKLYQCQDCNTRFETATRDESVSVQCNYCGSNHLLWIK